MSTSEEMQKQDLRVTKTTKAMTAAMLQLMESNTFAKISVNDICSLALVSRTTFYQHFQDKYELLSFSLDQAAQNFRARDGEDLPTIIEDLLGFVIEKRNVFRNLLRDGGNEELMRMLSEQAVSSLKNDLKERADIPGRIPVEVLAVFLSGGIAYLLTWWIRTDFAMSREELTGHLLAMFRKKVS